MGRDVAIVHIWGQREMHLEKKKKKLAGKRTRKNKA
jgi:hypothetical protein